MQTHSPGDGFQGTTTRDSGNGGLPPSCFGPFVLLLTDIYARAEKGRYISSGTELTSRSQREGERGYLHNLRPRWDCASSGSTRCLFHHIHNVQHGLRENLLLASKTSVGSSAGPDVEAQVVGDFFDHLFINDSRLPRVRVD